MAQNSDTETDEQHVRTAVIGLGTAGGVALAALTKVPALRLVAAVDPLGCAAKAAGGLEVPVHREIAELRAQAPFELMIVSCSTLRHGAAMLEAAALNPRRMWVEKPRVTTRAEYQDVMLQLRGIEIQTMLHRMFASELIYVGSHAPAWRRAHGPVVRIESRFSDPYEGTDAQCHALGDCWTDSGVNALTVVARLVQLDALEMASGQLPLAAVASFRFVDDGVPGTADVRCVWRGGTSKVTTIHFADQLTVSLDHNRARCTLRDPAGALVEQRDLPPRSLPQRYAAMFRAYHDRTEMMPSAETDWRIHDMLFQAKEALDARSR